VSQIKKHPAFKDAQITVEKLPAGDVWLDNVIIERKTVADLLASIADNRLPNQAAEMRALSEWCYLVICGPLLWANKKIVGTDWHYRSVQGALAQVQDLGVSVVHAHDERDFPATCAWLYGRSQKKIVRLAPRRFGLPLMPDEQIISALPGIGPEKANKLLDHFSTVIDVLVGLCDDKCSLPTGFGPKTREAVREVLGLSDNERIIKEKQK
jgi:ERCC4-type nuclease